MAETKLAPLSTQVPIVDEYGNPTPYFQQLMQIFIDEKNAAVDDITGIGTELDNLNFSDLNDVDMLSVPPEDGEVPTWDDANQLWVPGEGGGGGDLGVLHIAQVTLESAGPCAGSWMSRGLNTVVSNTIDGATAIPSSTVTMTIASPGVVTWTAHGLSNGTPIMFTTTGALPTGFTVGITYYVVSAATDTFQLSLTAGGAAINTSGSQSGTHTAKAGQFTLPAGTYDIEGDAKGAFSGVAAWRSRLYNLTDATEQAGTIGCNGQGNANVERHMTIRGRFTIASTKTFQIQTIATGTVSLFGHGVDGSLPSSEMNVYTSTMIRKVVAGTAPAATPGPWQVDTLWEHSVSGNTTTILSGDLTGYNEVRVVFEGSTTTSSGVRAVRVSVDGGSNYLSTSGDYKSVEPTGVVNSETCIFCHSTASTASRGGVVDIQLYPSGTVKAFTTPNRSFSAAGYVSGSLLPINKIAVTNLTVAGAAAGDFSSGKIWILKR